MENYFAGHKTVTIKKMGKQYALYCKVNVIIYNRYTLYTHIHSHKQTKKLLKKACGAQDANSPCNLEQCLQSSVNKRQFWRINETEIQELW